MPRLLSPAWAGCSLLLVLQPQLAAPQGQASANCVAAANAARPDSLDRLIRGAMARHGIVGVSVGIEQRGKVVARRAYGLANVELNVPATTCTVYQLSSATKTITGAVVMRLVEEGKLRLDDSLRTLLPNSPVAWHAVTLRRLLSHTTGLPEVRDVVAPTADSAIAVIAGRPASFPIGANWEYNQTNYLLIKQIIERVTGTTFQDHVRSVILTPLGMSQTAFGAMFSVIPGRATSYSPGPTLRVREYTFPEHLFTAAGLNSSVEDLLRWNSALVGGRFIAPASRDTMWTPARLTDGRVMHYAFGWDVNRTAGHRSAGHDGGGSVTFRRFIDDSVTVILLTNGSRHPFPTDDLAERIATVYAPGARDGASKTTDIMFAAIERGDTALARSAFDKLRSGPAPAGTTVVGAVNFLGSQLLDVGRNADALFVYQMNLQAHPQSPGAAAGVKRARDRLGIPPAG